MGLRDAIDDEQNKVSESASKWIAKFAEPKVRESVAEGYASAHFEAPKGVPDGVKEEILSQLLKEKFTVRIMCCRMWKIIAAPTLMNCEYCDGTIKEILIEW